MMLIYQKVYVVFVIFFISLSLFAQKEGYVKLDFPPISPKNVFLAKDEFAKLKESKSGSNKLSVGIFFDNSKGGSFENQDQVAVCNGLEQALLDMFVVMDRKLATRKLKDTAVSLGDEDIRGLDFVIILSDLSFDKKYKVLKGFVEKPLAFLYGSDKYKQEDLGQEYFLKGISITGKMVRVKDNRLLGSFTFDYAPCTGDGGCPFLMVKGAHGYILANLNNKKILPQEIDNLVDITEFIKILSTTITKALKTVI